MKVKKITELNRITIEQYKAVADKTPLVVVLDNVRSLNNIGSIFRSSDAFLISRIYLCGITATPPHADIHKTALGAEDSVDWLYVDRTEEAVQELRAAGYVVCAVEQAHNSIMLDQLELDSRAKYAIVLGNEVRGVQQSVVDLCHHCVEIPQCGTKHSLNVSVAAGIVIWQFFKSLKK